MCIVNKLLTNKWTFEVTRLTVHILTKTRKNCLWILFFKVKITFHKYLTL
jgi:hypothetical protein